MINSQPKATFVLYAFTVVLLQAYILVFDITKWDTFHCLNAVKADIDKNKDKKDVPVVLVLGNKKDLEHTSRQIETETVDKWAAREKGKFEYFKFYANFSRIFNELCS